MPIAPEHEHAFKEKSAKILILLTVRTIYFQTFQSETPCIFIYQFANQFLPSAVHWEWKCFRLPCVFWACVRGEGRGAISEFNFVIDKLFKWSAIVILDHNFCSKSDLLNQDSANFCHRKVTLKIRFMSFSTSSTLQICAVELQWKCIKKTVILKNYSSLLLTLVCCIFYKLKNVILELFSCSIFCIELNAHITSFRCI